MASPFPDNNQPQTNQPFNIGFGKDGAASIMNEAATRSWEKPRETSEEKEKLKEQVENLEEGEEKYNLDTLVGRFQKEFATYRIARQPNDLNIWVRAFLNNKGVYATAGFGTGINTDGSTSQAFVQFTSPKVRTATSMAMQVVLPPGDDSWTLDAPPEPFMPERAYELFQHGLTAPQIKEQLRIEAGDTSKSLSVKVKSGLDVAQWPSKLLQCVNDTVLFGTGFIEGPLAIPTLDLEETEIEATKDEGYGLLARLKAVWEKVRGEEKTKEEIVAELAKAGIIDPVKPDINVWSPFDVYLDPGCRRIEEGRSVIIRMVMNRAQLRELRKQAGFDENAINDVLNSYPEGNWKGESWESLIAIGNTNFQQNTPNGRFIVYKRWGMISGRDLRDAGIDIPDDRMEEQVMAQVWWSGDTIIRCSVSDELHCDRVPVYAVRFMLSPHSPYGVGVAEMMFDSQDAINACERAKMDNMGFVCRPQVMVRPGRLQVDEPTEAVEMRPGKIWKIRETTLPSNGEKPIEFWVPANALNEIGAVQQDSMSLADEQTALPRFLQGQNSEGTHNRTLGGATLQFDRAITPFKMAIFNIENDLIVPFIGNMGRFYQLFSNDPSIKGDFKVIARGVTGLMKREILMQRLSEFLTAAGNTPMLAQEVTKYLDPDKVWDTVFMGTGLGSADLMYSPEQRQQIAQQQAQAQAQQAQQQLQLATAPKQRAETAPKDALLEVMKEAPDGSQTKLAVIKEVMNVYQLMTPTEQQAIEHDMAALGLKDLDAAHQVGANMADRETPVDQMAQMQQPQRPQGGGQ